VVPDFDEAVAVFTGAARRAAGDVGAVVVKDFRAGAAGPVSAIIQKLSDLYLPPLLSPIRITRSGGRPISLVQMSKASSSSM
jgi:hypothetical protein